MITTFALAAALITALQDPMMGQPPKELKALGFLMGTFDTDLQMQMPGQSASVPLKGTVTTTESLGGMWIESRHEGSVGGDPMSGLQMTSYNQEKKKYVAYWYDNSAPVVTELWGTLKGQTLTLESKPTEFPGMGTYAFRETMSMKGAGKVLYRIEVNGGKGWTKLMEGTMTRR